MMGSRTLSSAGSRAQGWRERAGVLVVAGGIVSVIGVYLALNASRDSARDLLPYQTLAAQLPEADQRLFRSLREGLATAEADRVRASAWPEPASLAARGIAPFTSDRDAATYHWTRLQQGAIVNYFGQPRDPSAPAWLLEIQEPEPGMPPDTAPLDEEHHRLSDGTRVHTYVWMHRYGGQVPAGFVRQPQNSGWTQVFTAPPNPAFYSRR
jgi:hypothetical protein